jgi:hypothetical protein
LQGIENKSQIVPNNSLFNFLILFFVLLVFPTGARINDASELRQGTFPDGRRKAEFASVQQVADREQDLRTVVKQWLAEVV